MKRPLLFLILLLALASVGASQTTPVDSKQSPPASKVSADELHALLSREDVRADIGFTAAQVAKVEAIKKETLLEASKIRVKERSGQVTDAEAQLMALTESQKAKVEAVLTSEQSKRLYEIKVQLAGNLAVRNPDVATQLVITEDQKKQMDKAWEDHKAAVAATRKKIPTRELKVEDAFKEIQRLQQVYAENIGKILTPEQAAKLKEMGGKTFVPTPLPPTKPPVGG